METFITRILGMPILASDHGHRIDNLIWYIHLLMAVLFIGWFTYFIYVLIRFRASRNKSADYTGVKNHASGYIEGLVALIEVILLIGFAIPIWSMTTNQFPEESESEVIHVIGRQFYWVGRYPGADRQFGRQELNLVTNENPYGVDPNDPASADDFEVINDIVVPVNRDVITHITSMDVIHSFAVKAMRVTQDATPGLKIPVAFKPIRVGNYKIQCAQLCGSGHYAMAGTLKVLSEEDYDAWLASKAPVEEEANIATEGDYE